MPDPTTDGNFFVVPGEQQQNDACIPIFRMEAVEDKVKSETEGRPVYKEVPWVRILIPGAAGKDEVDRRVTEKDQLRWASQYGKFMHNRENVVEGTIIEQWGLISRTRAAELKACNILTVEQLAEVADQYLKKLGPGAQDLRQKAKEFLLSTKGNTSYKETQEMLNAMKLRVQEVEGEMDILKETNAQLHSVNEALNEKLSRALLGTVDKVPKTAKKTAKKRTVKKAA